MQIIKKYLQDRKATKLAIEEALAAKKQAEDNAAKEALEHKVRMESAVPWYKLIGEQYNLESPPLAPISERYQWNKAFITSLREQGYKGETDHEVIKDWEDKTERKKMQRIAELERETKKNSSEPWVEVVSEKYDDDTKQVEMRLDWNNAFIKMLRSNGYTGRDEQEIVDKWFKRLSENIASDLHSAGYDG